MTAPAIRHFGTTTSGEAVESLRLQSGQLTAVVLTRGAVLQDLRLAGVPWSLTLGSDLLEAYKGPMAYFGAVVGPVANRIGGASATICGRASRFMPNEGPNLLHSGETGTHALIWQATESGPGFVRLSLDLPDGLGGFPGNREISARYEIEDDTLTLTLEAVSDRPTLMNLAHHGYWNMDGGTDTLGQRLKVAADRYLPVDAALLPVGGPAPVEGVFDLRERRTLDLTEGFDHNFCLADAPRTPTFAAELTGTKGVRMSIETTEPGLQVYDGRGIDTAPYLGHSGVPYRHHAGIALEPQRWPDAAGRPDFPSILLTPGQTYRQITRFRFSRI